MQLDSMEKLLVNELQDLFSAESQLLKALPKMQNAASSHELKEALKKHLAETKLQAERLETALNLLQADTKGQVCEAMKGLITEAEEILNSSSSAILKDAAMIGAAQKIEHYEIAGYGTAKAHAKLLDLDEIADLLAETLEEESAADKKLTKIAEGSLFNSGVNKKASG
ncbi:MAG: hypothetical protein BGO14_06330 [Chlamydiales bacterium 38-26]|nr:ferritin-like domain-containing protein [Chlamydiales bacterium]OJV08503.1 MAG: hypothetical protein BGO14_06330 [Chlamydiales bacterium 38-26]